MPKHVHDIAVATEFRVGLVMRGGYMDYIAEHEDGIIFVLFVR